MDRNEPEHFTVDAVKVETDKAFLILFEDGTEAWIPKSQILPESDVECGELVIPHWLATEKGLV